MLAKKWKRKIATYPFRQSLLVSYTENFDSQYINFDIFCNTIKNAQYIKADYLNSNLVSEQTIPRLTNVVYLNLFFAIQIIFSFQNLDTSRLKILSADTDFQNLFTLQPSLTLEKFVIFPLLKTNFPTQSKLQEFFLTFSNLKNIMFIYASQNQMQHYMEKLVNLDLPHVYVSHQIWHNDMHVKTL